MCAAASAVSESRANGRVPVKSFVGDDAERVGVGRGGHPEHLRLLGREVPGGPEHRTREGERVEARGRCDPEVANVHARLFVEEEVRGLDVAVHDTAGMGGVERERSLPEPRQRALGRLRPHGAARVRACRRSGTPSR